MSFLVLRCTSRAQKKILMGLSLGASGTGLAQVSSLGLLSCERNTQGWHGPGIFVFSIVKHWALLSAAGAKTTRESGVTQIASHY